MRLAILLHRRLITLAAASAFTDIHQTMPRGVLKENLPTKICIVCDRPFTWRKKWERVWDEVTTCSKSCNRKRKSSYRSDCDKRLNHCSVNADNEVGLDEDSFSLVGGLINMRTTHDSEVDSHNEVLSIREEDEEQAECNSDLDEDEGYDYNGDSDAKSQEDGDNNSLEPQNHKAQRKAEKKRKKAERRAQKMGKGDPTAGQKKCTLCSNSVNLLIRCTYDSSGIWVSASSLIFGLVLLNTNHTHSLFSIF